MGRHLASCLAICCAVASLAGCATTSEPPAADADPSGHPLGTGSVVFVGFSAAELQAFRVIPEEGLGLFVPGPGTRIENVDGFWWNGRRQWFKIPDHCQVTITKAAGGMEFANDCSALGTRIQRLRGGVAQACWVDDAGATSHTTDYPF